MRISELRAREDFSTILRSTLAAGWSRTLGVEVEVHAPGAGSGQEWFVNPVFSALHTRDVNVHARRFLADSFKFTPKRARLPFQFLLGTAAATRSGAELLARPVFSVRPGLPGASSIVVVPGNQRVRTFDLQTNKTRVFLKTGFDSECMRREIELRSQATTDAPFPPILVSDETATWFEEALMDGWSLPRCPPWIERRPLEEEAFETLGRWLRETSAPVSAEEYLGGVLASLEEGSSRLFVPSDERDALRRDFDRLGRLAKRLGSLELARSHGDFQPGNVFVERATKAVRLVDWEYSDERSIFYDRIVYCLDVRFRGWVDRFEAFARDGKAVRSRPPPLVNVRDEVERRSILALFALEEFQWRLRAASFVPSPVPFAGWSALVRGQLGRIVRSLDPRGEGGVR